MNPTFTTLKELRKPKIENLPDGRQRVTRWHTLPHGTQVNTFLAATYGTADVSYTDCRLIDLQLDTVLTRDNTEPALILVFEEIPATGEVQVGQNTRILLEDGREAIEALFLQFSSDTFVPGTVGTTTAPGDDSAYLQKVEQTNDGTLRRIKRTYVYAGTLSQTDDEKNNSKLDVRTIVSVKTVPATPSGYTLISTDVKSPNGLPVYTYTFAKGDGEVSRDTRYLQSDDQGTTGATVITIRHLTASSVDANPITTPTDTALVSEDKTDNDGHRVWTAVYAKGAGTVVTEQQTKEGGKLIIYHRVALGAAPSAPSATISGTVATVSTVVRKDSGYDVYDYTWAEGVGEVDRTTDTRLGGMLQRVAIRHLTAVATGTQPTSDPLSGGTITSEGRADQDGYRLWTVVWTKANTTSFILDASEKRNKGKLVLYRREKLGAAPAAPSATISGTVVETDSSERLEDGYTVYSKAWAEGVGTIRDDVDTRNGGKLKVYRKTALGTAPSAPSATISGTVTLIADDSREEQGVTLYDRTWAEGVGVYTTSKKALDAALLQNEVTLFTALADDLTDALAVTGVPTGTLVDYSETELDGVKRWELVLLSEQDGTALVAGTTGYTFEKYEEFVYPGRAKYYTTTVTMPSAVTGTVHDVYMSPPETALVLATHNITYQTSEAVGTLTNTLWNPKDSATLYAKYTFTNGEVYFPKSRVEGLRGFRAVNSGSSGTTSGADWTSSILGDRMPASSTWALSLDGGPADPAGTAWTLHAEVQPAFYDVENGVQWYRRLEITATPGSQTALPV